MIASGERAHLDHGSCSGTFDQMTPAGRIPGLSKCRPQNGGSTALIDAVMVETAGVHRRFLHGQNFIESSRNYWPTEERRKP